MSKYEYDEIDHPMEMTSEVKLSKLHRLLLKVESVATVRNFWILAIVCFFMHVIIIPEATYVINTIDKHYFGYFNERAP